jgi:hypothetical protein
MCKLLPFSYFTILHIQIYFQNFHVNKHESGGVLLQGFPVATTYIINENELTVVFCLRSSQTTTSTLRKTTTSTLRKQQQHVPTFL